MNMAFAIEARETLRRLSLWQRILIRYFHSKICIGAETREGWIKPSLFYIFWCAVCGKVAKDYVHGFTGDRYIDCPHCGSAHSFTSWEDAKEVIRFFVGFRLMFKHRRNLSVPPKPKA